MRLILIIAILATLAAIIVIATHRVFSVPPKQTRPDVTWAPAPGPGRVDLEHSQPLPLPSVPSTAPAGLPPVQGAYVPGSSGPGDAPR